MSLSGARILVVGASSGIGRAYATTAAAEGAHVAVAARRADLLTALADEIGGVAVPLDIADGASVEAGVAQAVSALGGLDVLLIAAGISPLAILDETDAELWQKVYAVNVIGPNLVLRAAIPHLGDDGVALVISSDGVGEPRAGLGVYTSSKAALNETLDVWRLEHPELRLVRLSVGPTMPTDIGREMEPGLAARLFPDWIARGQLPASFMTPDDVAAAIVSVSGAARGSSAIPHTLVLKPHQRVLQGEGAAEEMVAYVEETSTVS